MQMLIVNKVFDEVDVNKVDEDQISVIGPCEHLFNSINYILFLKTRVCYKTEMFCRNVYRLTFERSY